jgi:hypothetical protein
VTSGQADVGPVGLGAAGVVRRGSYALTRVECRGVGESGGHDGEGEEGWEGWHDGLIGCDDGFRGGSRSLGERIVAPGG